MEKEKKFARTLVTTALPYANGPVHIGHLAGVYVPADIYVRYLRLKGEDVMFVGGSDEHGVPVTQRARKEGITPQQVVDRYHSIIKESFKELGISYDIYSRTTSTIHHQFAAEFFRKLYDEGKLIEKVTKQFYSAGEGWGGDYDFEFISVSPEKIVLKGKRRDPEEHTSELQSR